MATPTPGEAARQLQAVAEKLEERSRNFTRLHEQMTALTVTETSTEGAVQVTVDGNGIPVELTVTDRGRGVDPAKLSADLMSCMRRAQAKLRQRVERLTTENVGEDGAGVAIRNQYAQRFPDQPAEPKRAPYGGEHRLGDIDDV